LVTKLTYEEELKGKFLEDLRNGLFAKHESFLSNPLLLSIMLLTYGQSAHIPDKLNVFYNQAYEALFERHDALKGGYQRQRKTKLDVQDFARVFSAFCLQTYDKRQFEFTRLQALDFVDKARSIVGIDCDKDDYLRDAMQAVCLLVEDGLSIVFSHRSFQEYFTARFISETRPDVQRNLVRKFSANVRTDSVMSLLYEMRPEVVEQYYILPELNRLTKTLGIRRTVGMEHYLAFLQKSYSRFELRDGEIWGTLLKERQTQDISRFCLRTCGHLIGWKGFTNTKEGTKFMWDKYGKDQEIVAFPTKALTVNDEFLCDLAEKTAYFSIEALRLLLKIRAALIAKSRTTEASLDEILVGRPRSRKRS
jgi:hypothetical protein